VDTYVCIVNRYTPFPTQQMMIMARYVTSAPPPFFSLNGKHHRRWRWATAATFVLLHVVTLLLSHRPTVTTALFLVHAFHAPPQPLTPQSRYALQQPTLRVSTHQDFGLPLRPCSRNINIRCHRRRTREGRPLLAWIETNAVLAAAATTTTITTATTAQHGAPLLGAVLSPIGSILILATIVLIHESGHFLAAKRFGIAVEEFSIGFGPKILGFVAGQDEFNLRWIPLGGYVRFPENYNTTLARDIQQADMVASEEYIRSRGPGFIEQILNALSLGFLEDQIWQNEKKRRIQELNDRRQQEPLLPWWKRFGNKKPKTSFMDVGAEIEYYDDPSLLQNRPWFERAVVLSGGVIFNLLLAFVIYFGQISVGPGIPIPTFDSGIVVASMPPPDAAASGVLRQGDIILRVNGVDVMPTSTVSSKPSVYESQKAISDFIAKIRATPNGEALVLTIAHPTKQNRNVDSVTPVVDVIVQPKRSTANGPMTIGTLLSPNYVQTGVLKTSNPMEAANLAAQYVSSITLETANGILSLIATFLFGSIGGGSSSVAGQVSGPLGLLRTGSEVVASQDWTTVLLFSAAISVNLAVINSLPLPALDGGQLVFVLSEAITGKKVNQQFQERVTAVAVLFLLLVSASTFVGDLNAVFGR
jgi:membrane-associated protease RseP (regulator of RpoE activity)